MTANKGLISDMIKKQCENMEAKTVIKVRVVTVPNTMPTETMK